MKKKLTAAASTLCFLLAVILLVLTEWYVRRFNTSFAGLLFTLMTPMKGVGGGFWSDFTADILPPVLRCLTVWILLYWLLRSERITRWLERREKRLFRLEKARAVIGKALPVLAAVLLAAGCVNVYQRLHVGEYLRNIHAQTTLYEDFYTAPDSAAVKAPEKTDA